MKYPKTCLPPENAFKAKYAPNKKIIAKQAVGDSFIAFFYIKFRAKCS